MHEIGLVEDTIYAIKSKLKDLGRDVKLKAVNVIIGEMEHVTPSHFEFHFREHTKGTMLENAKLNFKKEKAVLKCKDCGTEFLFKEKTQMSCPKCKSKSTDIIKGMKVYVESIEVG